jgi:cytidylate kinase
MEEEHQASLDNFIQPLIEKWKGREKTGQPVITVSVEPGSGGHVIGKQLAEMLGLDLFDRDIIKAIAESAHVSDQVVASIEKERLSGIQDFIASLVNDRYLWPGVYMEHLMKVIGIIAKHGGAVIIGRGANFIIPPEEHLSVLVVAPLERRVANVAQWFGVSEDEARRRVLQRESRRAAFIKQSYNADVTDAHNYNLVINTGKTDHDAAIGTIVGALMGGKKMADKRCFS